MSWASIVLVFLIGLTCAAAGDKLGHMIYSWWRTGPGNRRRPKPTHKGDQL